MTSDRSEPAFELPEREMLEAWLEYHRLTLEWKCEGLTPEQLRERAVPPSSMSLLGLVRHMAEAERNWFQRVLAQIPRAEAAPHYYSDDDPDGDFDNVDSADVDEAFDTWHAECDAARRVLAGFSSVDDVVGSPRGNDISVRWVLVHMIEEYARHNGHADLLRERIDGSVGD